MGDPGPDGQERRPAVRHERGSDEFSRVLAFSDGLFAIAMTLLVVGISVPTSTAVDDVGEMIQALGGVFPEVVGFAVSFIVIGRYWLAHHRFCALLRAVDSRLIAINLVYLAFIAFLPFPTDLLGNHFDNPISVATYAATVAVISGMEVVLFRRAYNAGLMRRDIPAPVYRWAVRMSLSPVAFFLASVPVAFASVNAAVAMWFLFVPYNMLEGRWKPAGADDYLS